MTIHCIDHEFLDTPEVIASYLVEGPKGLILIESGPATTQTTLEANLKAIGVNPEDISHVFVTHIHLDHAGGAGYWARRGAQIYVHPKGAPHLIDPSKLIASATRIYQEQMDRLWGTTLPVPADHVVEVPEGEFQVAGLTFQAWDTPGHAAHHLAFGLDGDLFTGDVAGVRLPRCPYVSVPAPPPEFQLEDWVHSLDKLIACGPERLHLTHFGGNFPARDHLDQLRQRLVECVDFVAANLDLKPLELQKAYQNWDHSQALACGVDDSSYAAYEKANPVFMSTQGITRYLRKFRAT